MMDYQKAIEKIQSNIEKIKDSSGNLDTLMETARETFSLIEDCQEKLRDAEKELESFRKPDA